jgi:2-keto-4-pentenoate hydratase/2-oxohepta-3-ene-1,7-dioic acid hydratase in catechol pathway
MKIVVYGPQRRVGVLEGDIVVDAAVAVAAHVPGEHVPPDLTSFIESGERGLESMRKALERVRSSEPDGSTVFAANAVQLHAPRPAGAKIACAGGNFADHLAAMAAKGRDADARTFSDDLSAVAAEARERGIWGFWKVGRDAAGPNAEIIYPERCTRLDYEAELAVVLGKAGKKIKADRLRDYVWGVTLFADWSARDTPEARAPYQFVLRKNFDTSFSMGPCIVVGELDPMDVLIETHVNGELRQSFNSGEMIYSFGEYLEYLSHDFTFEPGDVISGGTAAGTAADSSEIAGGVYAPERFLKPGDTVDISSPVIGTLRSRVIRA